MTPIATLANRALANVDHGVAVEFDPVTITILLAVLGAIITHYVEKCLDKIDHKTVTAPTRAERAQLRIKCVLVATQKRAGWRVAMQAYDALLKTGAGMTEADLAGLKAGV